MYALADLAAALPAGSAVHRATDPDHAWTIEALLLAHVVDLLALSVWQRGGGKGPRPKPIPRPGARPDSRTLDLDSFDSPEAFDAWAAARRQARTT